MANLIKASTALKRSESVDVTKQYLDGVSNAILDAAKAGRTDAWVWVPDNQSEAITEKLLDLGYVVEFGQMFGEIVDFVDKGRGLLRRILDFILRRKPAQVPVFAEPTVNRSDMRISWAPVPEVVEEDEADESVAIAF